MKNLFTLLLACTVLCSQAQQKKTAPKTNTAPKKTTTKTAVSAPSTQTVKESNPVQPVKETPATPPQEAYDKYQESRTVVVAPIEQPPKVGSVIKLNFMRLIVGGIDVEFEKRIAPKSSAILTGGYYAYGLLKGGYRLGMDYRQYLGKSYSPKGLYVSAGAMGNFVPFKDNMLIGKTTVILLNLRALVGYQILSGHFVFDVAAGPAYGFVTSTDTFSDPDKALKVGLLPAVKLSLGYAF
jgi:hypothetical protein